MIETDVIPPDYTPGMLRLDAKLVYDDKGFCADIVNLIVKGKIHLEDQSDKNQQILIRVNEGATRNNAVLPQSSYYWKRYFVKAIRSFLRGDATESYAGHFYGCRNFICRVKSLRFTGLILFCNGVDWQYWRSFFTVT